MFLNCTKADDVPKAVKDKGVQMIDLRFTDLPGTWQHFSVPPSAVDADALAEGIGFDESSIRGFQAIQESDSRPRHRAALQPRRSPHRSEGGNLPQEHGPRRRRLLRLGGGV